VLKCKIDWSDPTKEIKIVNVERESVEQGSRKGSDRVNGNVSGMHTYFKISRLPVDSNKFEELDTTEEAGDMDYNNISSNPGTSGLTSIHDVKIEDYITNKSLIMMNS
jgi:hypothetical protein